jgi:hypothetical protein
MCCHAQLPVRSLLVLAAWIGCWGAHWSCISSLLALLLLQQQQ